MQEYTVDLQPYYSQGPVTANCNEITFINLGTATVTLNGVLPLTQGQSLSISGNLGEVDKTIYQVDFASGTNNLLVIRKQYS